MHNIKYGATIGDAMDWFKTMTTNEYIRGVKTWGWEPFNGKLWQRN
jgi:putative transposase